MNTATKATPIIARYLQCPRHGDRKWQGHVMCDACGRVWQTEDERAPRFAPETCPCGVALMPPPTEKVGEDSLGFAAGGILVDLEDGNILKAKIDARWSARPICYCCFRFTVKKNNGRVQGWGGEEWKKWRASQEGS